MVRLTHPLTGVTVYASEEQAERLLQQGYTKKSESKAKEPETKQPKKTRK